MNRDTLKTILRAKGLTPSQVAARANLSRQLLSHWLSPNAPAKLNVSTDKLEQLATALDVSPDDLLKSLPDLTELNSQKTLYFWDRLFSDFTSFAIALARFYPPAVGRLVQTVGIFQSEKILGKRIWRIFTTINDSFTQLSVKTWRPFGQHKNPST
jgi:transcriptional regulator with XRE-family HTH domain